MKYKVIMQTSNFEPLWVANIFMSKNANEVKDVSF